MPHQEQRLLTAPPALQLQVSSQHMHSQFSRDRRFQRQGRCLPDIGLCTSALLALLLELMRGISRRGSGSASIHGYSPGSGEGNELRSRRQESSAAALRREELTSSLACFDQARLHTCDPVSMHCRGCPVSVFQKRMHRSAVPPPEARRPCWCGDQAMAFTAARCSVYCWTGLRLE